MHPTWRGSAMMESMTGVLQGFTTIGLLVVLGFALAHWRVFDLSAQQMMGRLAFFVASPALMFTVLQEADVRGVLSASLVAIAAAVGSVLLAHVALARFVFRHDLATTTLGAMCSTYANAGNLGLPIAAYVLGDAALVAPILLLQLLVLQPLVLTILDTAVSEQRLSPWKVLSRPVRNPLTIASVAGLLLSLIDASLPRAVADPVELVGGMAVPAMLIAFGISLRLGPRPGTGGGPAVLGTIVVLKLVVQPLVAYLVGRFVLDLPTEALVAVTVLSALPTAQNVFVIAVRYERALVLTRDAVFATTVLSVPAIATITALVV